MLFYPQRDQPPPPPPPENVALLVEGLRQFLDANAAKGWRRVDDFRGTRRDRVVAQSKIRRPGEKDYRGGYDAEGYAHEEAAARGN